MTMTVPCMGGCACGAVRYECSAAPVFMFLCHCRDCQRATGNPFAANVWFAVSALCFLNGEPQYHVVQSLGNTVDHGFCPACGSPLGMKSSGFPDIIGVRAATLDDPSGLEPLAELWTCRAYPWEPLNPNLPHFERNLTADDLRALLDSRS